MPGTVWLYDSVDLAKHGRAGTLGILDSHPGTIVITKEIYSELVDGEGFPGANAAIAWLLLHQNDPHYQIDATYVSPTERAAAFGQPTSQDVGELSIAQMVNAINGLSPGTSIFVVSDSPQARTVTDDFAGASHVVSRLG